MWRQMLLVDEDPVDVPPAGPNSRVCMSKTSEWARMWW